MTVVIAGEALVAGMAMVARNGFISGGEICLHRRTVVAAENMYVRK